MEGGQESKKPHTCSCFPTVLPSFLNFQGLETPWTTMLSSLGNIHLMVDFTVLSISFHICNHFVPHMLSLFPFLLFPLGKCVNKYLLVLRIQKAPSFMCVPKFVLQVSAYVRSSHETYELRPYEVLSILELKSRRKVKEVECVTYMLETQFFSPYHIVC